MPIVGMNVPVSTEVAYLWYYYEIVYMAALIYLVHTAVCTVLPIVASPLKTFFSNLVHNIIKETPDYNAVKKNNKKAGEQQDHDE